MCSFKRVKWSSGSLSSILPLSRVGLASLCARSPHGVLKEAAFLSWGPGWPSERRHSELNTCHFRTWLWSSCRLWWAGPLAVLCKKKKLMEKVSSFQSLFSDLPLTKKKNLQYKKDSHILFALLSLSLATYQIIPEVLLDKSPTH